MNRKEIAAYLLQVDPESLLVFRDMAELGVVAIKANGQKFTFTNEQLKSAEIEIQAEELALIKESKLEARAAKREAAEPRDSGAERQAKSRAAEAPAKPKAAPAKRSRRTTTKKTTKP